MYTIAHIARVHRVGVSIVTQTRISGSATPKGADVTALAVVTRRSVGVAGRRLIGSDVTNVSLRTHHSTLIR